MPRSQCRSFGIVETDADLRIVDFKEKPDTTPGMPGKPTHALASMGNYIFSTDVLLTELRRARDAGERDFGRDLLPRMVRTHRLMAYDFTENVIPGTASFEERRHLPGQQRLLSRHGCLGAGFSQGTDAVPRPAAGLARTGGQAMSAPSRGQVSQTLSSQLIGRSTRRVRLVTVLLSMTPDGSLTMSISPPGCCLA